MTPGKRYLIVFSCLVMATFQMQAQALVKAFVDKDVILVGEPIQLTVEARFPLGETVKWYTTDSLAHFEWIDKGSPQDTNDVDGKKRIQTSVITSYDTGQWTIPAFTISIGNKQYSSDTISISVKYNDGFNADEEYREIKETEAVEVPFDKKKLWYILGGILLLALILMLFFMRKKKSKTPTSVVSTLSPFDRAMKELEQLKSFQPKDQTATKAFYTSLNDVLRHYLADQWKLSTKEKTNEELILQLRSYKLNEEQFTQLAQCLRLSDFVKFAKYLPEERDNQLALQVTEAAIKQLHKTTESSAV